MTDPKGFVIFALSIVLVTIIIINVLPGQTKVDLKTQSARIGETIQPALGTAIVCSTPADCTAVQTVGPYWVQRLPAPSGPGPCALGHTKAFAVDAAGYLYVCSAAPLDQSVWLRSAQPMVRNW